MVWRLPNKKGFYRKNRLTYLIKTDYVKPIVVHCRIGSLETEFPNEHITWKVHCRIGSLEMSKVGQERGDAVHCRIGSLENKHPPRNTQYIVHCRIGSLEKE